MTSPDAAGAMATSRRIAALAARVAAVMIGAATLLSCGGRPMRGDTGIRPYAFDLWDVHCPSGLRVIVERAPGSRVAGVTAVVGTGSQDDPPGREGLAHLVEHLSFRGHGDGQEALDRRMGALGSTGNASTDFEETVYYTFTSSENLGALLSLEGERLAGPLTGIGDDVFNVEREVVRSELRERNETGFSGRALSMIQEALFPVSHPYNRPIGGTHPSISAVTMEDARAFVAAHYRPEAMTLLVVGDVDLAGAEALVKRSLPPALYGDPAHGRPVTARRLPAAQPAPPPPPPAAASLRRADASVETPELWIAWSLPGGFGPERFIGAMWAALAQTSFASGDLDDADVAHVSFFPLTGAQATLLVCRVELVQGTHPEKSAETVLKELPWVADDDLFLETHFKWLKATAMRNLAWSGESVEARSQARAEYAHFAGSLGYYGAAMDTIRSITAAAGRQFAESYLAPSRARTILLQPRPPETVADRAVAPPTGGAPDGRLVVPMAPWPGTKVTGAAKDRARPSRLGEVRSVTLPNGMPLIAVRRRGAPVITAALGFHGGTAIGKPGVGRAAIAALKLATEESPSDYGIGIWFSVDRDSTVETGRAGAANLPRLLDMLTFSLRGYDVDWPSDKVKTKLIPLWRERDASPDSQARRSFWSALYGAHAYGVVPTADAIAALQEDEVGDWFRRTLTPHNAALVVVGDIDPAEVEAAARAAIGRWQEPGGAIAPPPVAAPQPRPALAQAALPSLAQPLITHRPASTQATVLLGCLLPSANAEEAAARQVAAKVLEYSLGERLREKRGATYGVHSASNVLRGGTSEILITTTVDNAWLGEALEIIGSTFTHPSAGERSAGLDLDLARGSIGASTLLEDTSATLAAEILERWNLGWPLSTLDDYPDAIAATTAAQVDATIDACARNMVLSIIGDQQVARQALLRH